MLSEQSDWLRDVALRSRRILNATHGLVVIDEAYFEFSDQTALPLLEQHENLIVLRTFSKAMALAALRVGYLLAAPDLVREISKSVLPYNLNVVLADGRRSGHRDAPDGNEAPDQSHPY